MTETSKSSDYHKIVSFTARYTAPSDNKKSRQWCQQLKAEIKKERAKEKYREMKRKRIRSRGKTDSAALK